MWAAGRRHDDLGWMESAASSSSRDLDMSPQLQDVLFHAVANNSSANIRCGDCGASWLYLYLACQADLAGSLW